MTFRLAWPHTQPDHAEPLAPGVRDAALNWRYAVKTFDATRRIAPDTWAALENSLVMSPSSYAKRTITPADLDQLIQATSAARGVPTEQLDFYRELMQKDLIDGPRSQQIERWASNRCTSPWAPS